MEPTDVPFEAVNQRGLFTRAQAYAEGWSVRQVRRRLAAGRWMVVAGSALAAADLTIGARELGQAALLTWPDAVISHRTAGAIHGLPIDAGVVGHAIVPLAASRRTAGLQAYRWPLRLDERVRLGRLTVTTERRTAVDLLRGLPTEDARHLYAWLSTRRVLTLDDLREELEQPQRRLGNDRLRRLVRLAASGSLSPAEDAFHQILRRARIRGWQANAAVVAGRHTYVVDVLFAAARVVVEVDGYRSHSSREAFQRDRVRQNHLVSAGYLVLRFTWADLTRRPDDVAAQVRAALARQIVGWGPG